MLWLCLGNELFYIYLYYTNFFQLQNDQIIFIMLVVPWFGKQIMNVIQLISSCLDINDHEEFLNKNKK
jgi:hypothetical protein